MEQLPPSGWDQVATKDDVKASEKLLQRELKASEKMFEGALKETEGRLMVEIAASELRQGARIDATNTRLDQTNKELSRAQGRGEDRVRRTATHSGQAHAMDGGGAPRVRGVDVRAADDRAPLTSGPPPARAQGGMGVWGG